MNYKNRAKEMVGAIREVKDIEARSIVENALNLAFAMGRAKREVVGPDCGFPETTHKHRRDRDSLQS